MANAAITIKTIVRNVITRSIFDSVIITGCCHPVNQFIQAVLAGLFQHLLAWQVQRPGQQLLRPRRFRP